MNRIAVLASGSGTNLQALLDSISSGALDAEIAVVVSNRPGAGAQLRATAAGVPALFLPLADRRDPALRLAYDQRLADVLAAFEPGLVVLAGWMLILSSAFLDRFPGRILNIHPALLPDDEGCEVVTSRGVLPALRGASTVRDALRQQLPITGATAHYVTATVDAGPVILKEEVPVFPGDDERTLHERIKCVEHRLLPLAVATALTALKRDGE